LWWGGLGGGVWGGGGGGVTPLCFISVASYFAWASHVQQKQNAGPFGMAALQGSGDRGRATGVARRWGALAVSGACAVVVESRRAVAKAADGRVHGNILNLAYQPGTDGFIAKFGIIVYLPSSCCAAGGAAPRGGRGGASPSRHTINPSSHSAEGSLVTLADCCTCSESTQVPTCASSGSTAWKHAWKTEGARRTALWREAKCMKSGARPRAG